MRVLYVGVYADSEMISYVNKRSKKEGSISIAATKYTRLIGDGLRADIGDKCTNLFLVPMGMYPVSKIILLAPKKKNGDVYIPFINFLLLKQIMISLYLFFFAINWYFKDRDNEKKVIIFSFVYLPFLIGVAPLKLFKNIFVTTFVPDMPEYEFTYSKKKFSVKNILVPLYISLSKIIVSITDYFVFITQYMVGCYSKRPYSIIEGFTDCKIDNGVEVKYSDKKAIMYAGSLYEKFGVKLLINAFIDITGDYELWLFGNGDMENEIKKSVEVDPRIKYFGNRPNNEILEFEKRAKLLVNPRFTNNEFTKFSFPSKLMEYMASGTPVLTTRLLGIPDDYSDKMFYIEEETVQGLKNSILMCFSKSQEELDLFGNNAKSYVLINKNNLIQIKELLKIMNLKLSK